MQFLYKDSGAAYFMHPVSYDQKEVALDVLKDSILWLKPDALCKVTLFNEEPIAVEVENFVELAIVECEPGVKGDDTVTGASKNASLETGAHVKVPLFVEEGDVVKIDTRDGSYVSRVTK